jgi:hypothetical protein
MYSNDNKIMRKMGKIKFSILLVIVFFIQSIQLSIGQCSICTKTAQQLGEGPAHSLNGGILYLMFTPLAIMAFIGWRWWRKEKEFL